MHSTSRFAAGARAFVLAVVALMTLPGNHVTLASPNATITAGSSAVRNLGSIGTRRLTFLPNAGRTDTRVRFTARAGGATFYFTREEAVLALIKGKQGHALRLGFRGANPAATLEGTRLAPGRVNHLIGSDPARWRTGGPSYHEIVYRDLWPGIDLAFRGENGGLKYEFRVAAGADPNDIGLVYRGAGRLSLGKAGDLQIDTPLGVLRDGKPIAYQETGDERELVASTYALDGDGYGFALGSYDRTRPLVIDPDLDYSTYLGGSGFDEGRDIALDASGAVYVIGNAGSVDFPTSAGAFDPTANADGDAFVAKFDPAGNLVYSTYLGGARGDGGTGIAVDSTGTAYVIGITYSPDFPATAGAFDTTMNGGDIFVAKLNPSGSALAYATFLGGQGSAAQSLNGFNNDIAADAVGSAYVTGLADGPDFPTTPGAFDTTQKSGFVAKLNPAGSALEYSTFLGGTGGTVPLALAIDGSGSAYVTGFTAASDFPTTPGAFDRTKSGPLDAFVTKLNPAGSALEYSTLLGGISDDQGNGIAVDSSGNAYITGASESVDLPTTPCAFDRTRGGFEDAFVAKLNPSGTALVYSTFLGGAALGFESGYGIAVDASGSVAVAGATRAADFPVTPDAFDATVGGVLDGFVAKLNPSGLVTYATFLGGSGDDLIVDIALDGLAGAYLIGATSSSDFPTTPGAFDATLGGSRDAFATKMTLPAESFTPAPATLQLAPSSGTRPVGTTHTVTAIVADAGGNPSPGITVRFTVTGATTVSGSCVTGPDGQCAFTYQGPAFPGASAISAFADTDGNGARDSCREPSASASVTWVAVAPAVVTLTPPDDINPVSTGHCVTATVLNVLGNPLSGVTVRFTVSGASAVSAVLVSNAIGQATLCYTGPDLPGADGITAHADTDGDGVVDGGEPVGGATKTWVVPEATPGQVTGGGLAPAATGTDLIAFGFNAKSGEGGLKGHCDVIDRASDVQIKCLDVTALVRDGTRVTLFGNATINGTSTTYRIDVDDLAESGAGHDTFRIVTASGYRAGGILDAGNVQAK